MHVYVCIYKLTHNHIFKTMYNCIQLGDTKLPLYVCFQSIH